MNRQQPWTPQEDARLIATYQAGMPYAQLAVELGRSRKSISERLSRLVDWRRPSRPASKRKIRTPPPFVGLTADDLAWKGL